MKLNRRFWALLACVLVVFHVLAFCIPFSRSAVFWIAYATTLLTLLVLGLISNRIFKSGSDAESILFGWPVFRVACFFAGLQLVVFFVLAALAAVCPVWGSVIAETLILAAGFIGLLIRNTAEQMVRTSETAAVDVTAVIKQLRAQAVALAKNNTDPQLQSAYDRLSDALRYADPVSGDATTAIDAEIQQKFTLFSGDAASNARLVDEILQLLTKRSALCKSGKK